MFSGDKYFNGKWRSYYENEPEGDTNPSPLGQFYNGTIVGLLLDMDRGFLSFFKDGIDMGQAFVSPELRTGTLYPFIQTQGKCKLHLFMPKVHP